MRPTLRVWNGYQLLWQDVFTDLFNLVLDAKQNHGPLKRTYEDRAVTVELSSPLDTDYEQMVDSLTAYWDRGILRPRTISGLALSQQEIGLSAETIEEELNIMYPEAQQEADKVKARPAILAAIAKGRELSAEEAERLLEN